MFTDGLRAALGPSFRDANGVIRCGTPTAPIPGCTPINFLALPNDAEAAAILRSLVPDGRDLEDSSLIIYSAHLTGPVLPLRAGRAAFAVGMERREESLNLRPDFLARTGRRTGNSQQPLEGELEANEFYGELAVPILGGLAGVQRLEAQLGLRHSRYAASGNITNGRIGLQWRPIAGLLIRGSYAEVFQEPVIFQRFGDRFTFFSLFEDPCNGETTPAGVRRNIDRACAGVPRDGSFEQASGFVPVIAGANPDLRAEDGAAISWGATYNPPFFEPLALEVNIWNVRLDGTISSVGAQQRLDQCYNNGRFCESIERDVSTRQVTTVHDLMENAGRFVTGGIDLGLRLQSVNTRIGAITYLLHATYLNRSEEEVVQADPTTRLVNVGRLDFGNYARWRAQSSLQWLRGPLKATVQSQYVHNVSEDPRDRGVNPFAGDCAPGMTIEPSGAVCRRNVGSYFRSHIAGTYTFAPLSLALSLGVDNVFDRQPPLAYSEFNNNTDVSTYDTVGRFFWARLRMAF